MSLIDNRKAVKAVETIQKYCSERPCNGTCVFYNKISATCKLNVKSPDKFPVKLNN